MRKFSWWYILVVVYPVVEIAVTIECVRFLGGLLTLLLYVVLALVGYRIKLPRKKRMQENMKRIKVHQARQQREGEASASVDDPLVIRSWAEAMIYAFTSWGLWLPGLLSHVVAFALMVPPLRDSLTDRLTNGFIKGNEVRAQERRAVEGSPGREKGV